MRVELIYRTFQTAAAKVEAVLGPVSHARLKQPGPFCARSPEAPPPARISIGSGASSQLGERARAWGNRSAAPNAVFPSEGHSLVQRPLVLPSDALSTEPRFGGWTNRGHFDQEGCPSCFVQHDSGSAAQERSVLLLVSFGGEPRPSRLRIGALEAAGVPVPRSDSGTRRIWTETNCQRTDSTPLG